MKIHFDLSTSYMHVHKILPVWLRPMRHASIVSTAPDWRKELDDFLLAYRTTPHTVTGEVPADIFFLGLK